MVVTSDDYFEFMNTASYFSRKLSTVLHENTVVILGYSLGDANLKAILSDYKGFVQSHRVSNSIFLVSRGSVDQTIIDYYSNCYGIRVIGTLVEVPGTSMEAAYLKAVQYSMENSSKKQRLGYSWHAYGVWEGRWSSISAPNRKMITSFIKKNSGDDDALRIVSKD